MRVLLDTCTLLWALQAPGRIPSKLRRELENPENSIHVSSVSFWEIGLKFSIGKLEIRGANPDDFPGFVEKSGWQIQALHAETAATFHRLPRVPEHRDPFDRMLIWIAIRENFHFASRDGVLPAYEKLGLMVCG